MSSGSGGQVSFYDALGATPLFAGLDAADVAELLPITERFSLAKGTRLFEQDDPADGVYLVTEGQLVVEARTPGDGLIRVAECGPGEVLGEFCLLDGGRRSAEVTAERATAGFRIDLERFQGLQAGQNPAALAVLSRLRGDVARRTLSTINDISRLVGPEGAPAAAKAVPAPARTDAEMCKALLASFPGFDRLRPEQWFEFAAITQRIEGPRGALVEAAGGAREAVYIVARGALRVGLSGRDAGRQLLIHGPGSIAGVAGMFLDSDWPVTLDLREDAIVFAMPTQEFGRVAAAGTQFSYRLLDLAGRHMTRDLRRLSRVFARLDAERPGRAA